MSDIVHREGGELFTTSEIIADRAEVEHRAVLQLIGRYEDDLAEFGQVSFQMRPGYNNAKVRVAQLNEQQSTLLLTYLRNTQTVRAFKKDLVKAFYTMAQQLAEPAPLDELEVAERYVAQIKRNRELEAQAAIDHPKAEAYDQFLDADGTYSVGTVAKMLGLSQNKLFQQLRNHGVMIAKGAMRNTPYQQYTHHFDVNAYSYTRKDGTQASSYTTRVQPSGVDFIRRKLHIEPKQSALFTDGLKLVPSGKRLAS